MPNDSLGLVGLTIDGKYRVEEVVAETHLSVVYRAVHRVWRRPVAIKAFKAGHVAESQRAGLLAAFIREGAILTELSERCAAICQARDVSSIMSEDGHWVPYLVLEWLDGETLDAMLVREREGGARPRTVAEAICLLEPVSRALALAHDRDVVHRDVKPGNIVVLASGCKLLDFGIASMLHSALAASSGSGSGNGRAGAAAADVEQDPSFTPAYGAPEQFLPELGPTGPWTDEYALALVFVELVTGLEPLGSGDIGESSTRSCDPARRPTPATLGKPIDPVVERTLGRALSLLPSERFGHVGEFWSALKSVAPSRWADASHTIPIPLRRPRSSRSWRRLFGGAST
ncbi:MAG TPA: serine/threonine-protein kinase [Polyangiaceae bacterium]|jgi:serine/threonine protein kinase